MNTLRSQKRQTRLNLAACLGPTYYFNCALGLFPGRYDLTNYTHSDEYEVSYKGKAGKIIILKIHIQSNLIF